MKGKTDSQRVGVWREKDRSWRERLTESWSMERDRKEMERETHKEERD